MTAALRETPLHAWHVSHGGRLVPFGGWSMPVQYPSGILAEHRAIRGGVGLFDISHMGRVEVGGAGGGELLQRTLTNDVAALAPLRAHYSLLCNSRGGVLDDVIVYRLEGPNPPAPFPAREGGGGVAARRLLDRVGRGTAQGSGREAAQGAHWAALRCQYGVCGDGIGQLPRLAPRRNFSTASTISLPVGRSAGPAPPSLAGKGAGRVGSVPATVCQGPWAKSSSAPAWPCSAASC